MAVTIRIKRRAAGGAAGAPASLKSTEIAYNEVDDTLYIGFGDDGNGNATSIRAFAGAGTFVTKAFLDAELADLEIGELEISSITGLQSALDGKAASDHTHGAAVSGGAAGFLTGADKAKLDAIAANANNYVHPTTDGNRHVPTTGSDDTNKFLKSNGTAGGVADWASVSKSDVGLGSVDNTSDANKPVSSATQTALDAKAPLASPALTGVPTAPTATPGTNTTQIATMAAVQAAVASLIDGAPGAIDTLNELAAALGDDPAFATTVTNALAGKLTAANNLADLTDAEEARVNLGLGSMATQASSAVAITGGSISGVDFDGGTF